MDQMIKFYFYVAAVVMVTCGAAPAIAADPDDPHAPVPAMRCQSITAGTKSYRPIEPLPWGDVNRRVTPPGAVPAPAQPPRQKRGALPGAADVALPKGSREIKDEANQATTPQQHNAP